MVLAFFVTDFVRKNKPRATSAILAEPLSSVGRVADLRTGGGWSDPRFGQYFFRGLMIVIATGFIFLSPLSIVSTMGKQPVAWKEYCAEYCLKKLQDSMNRCTGRRDITEILLKTALNNQSSAILELKKKKNA